MAFFTSSKFGNRDEITQAAKKWCRWVKLKRGVAANRSDGKGTHVWRYLKASPILSGSQTPRDLSSSLICSDVVEFGTSILVAQSESDFVKFRKRKKSFPESTVKASIGHGSEQNLKINVSSFSTNISVLRMRIQHERQVGRETMTSAN